MRDWALPLLRCLECGATSLEARPADISCLTCGTTYERRGDVVDFLHRPHPTILREREAVHRIDREAGAPPGWMDVVLGRLERGELSEDDIRSSAHLRAIAESRAQVLELFEREALAPGSTVLELGADVGWASALLLKARCRVIATEITDHLFLAPHGDSPDLCRLLADMNRVPVADSTVDVVFGASCVHHSWDLSLTFHEIARMLKPGGTAFLCGEPLPSFLRFVSGRRFGYRERSLGINETWVRRSEWLRLCRAAGLTPRIIFPTLNERQLSDRLRKRRLPSAAGDLLRLIMPMLQVSVHLRADKAPDASRASVRREPGDLTGLSTDSR